MTFEKYNFEQFTSEPPKNRKYEGIHVGVKDMQVTYSLTKKMYAGKVYEFFFDKSGEAIFVKENANGNSGVRARKGPDRSLKFYCSLAR